MSDTSLDPELIKKIDNDVKGIVKQIDGLIDLILNRPANLVDVKAYSMERTYRGDVNPNSLDLHPLTGGEAIEKALDNFRLQYIQYGEPTVPKRIIGALIIHPRIKGQLSDLIYDVNMAKDDLLKNMKADVGTTYMRTRYLKACESGVNVASLYRHINLAPDNVYRVSHSWNDKQKSPQPKTKKEVEEMIGELDDVRSENGVVELSKAERHRLELAKLPSLIETDNYVEEFVYLCGVKAHIEQIARYKALLPDDTFKRKRVVYKASSPLLIFKEPPELELMTFIPPKPYKREEAENQVIHYEPVLPHLGIYKRKKTYKRVEQV